MSKKDKNNLNRFSKKTVLKVLFFILLYGLLDHYLKDLTIYKDAGFSFRIQIIIPLLVGYYYGPVNGFIVGFLGNVLGDCLDGYGCFEFLVYSISNGLLGFFMGFFPDRHSKIEDPKHLAYLYIYIFAVNIISFSFAVVFDALISSSDFLAMVSETALPIIISNIIVCSLLIPAILYFKKRIKKLLVNKILLFIYYYSFFIAVGTTVVILFYISVYMDYEFITINHELFFYNLLIVPIIIINTLGFLLSYNITDQLMNPLTKFILGVKEVSENNFRGKVDTGSGPEIDQLGNSFNQMVEQLEVYTEELEKSTREQEKIKTELNVAARIQQSILPHNSKQFSEEAGIDIYAEMIPAKTVGGDLYNYFFIDNLHIGFFIADVSGKSVPASLFMMTANTIMRSQLRADADLEEVFNEVNHFLCENNTEEYFVTAFMGILNIKTYELEFINAGHNPPAIKRAGQDFEELDTITNFVLGGIEGIEYKSQKTRLFKEDVLFLFTDGVTEATDSENNMYSTPSLIKNLNKSVVNNNNSEIVVKDIIESVNEFMDDETQSDDITILCITI
jgi:sigma-B regulation protein RsbU (phosphoserine phosphatase)